MGSGVSSISENLTIQDCQALVGSHFSMNIFQSYCDKDTGLLEKNVFLKLCQSRLLQNHSQRAYSGDSVSVTGHSHFVRCITVHPNGDIFSGSSDKSIRQYRIKGLNFETVKVYSGHAKWVMFLVVHSPDVLVSGSFDTNVMIWSITSGECLMTLSGHTSVICCGIALLDGTILTGGEDKTLRRWSIADSALTQTITGAETYIQCVAQIDDDTVVAGEYESDIRVYSLSASSVLQVLRAHRDSVWSITTGFLGEIISVSQDKSLRVWSLEEGVYTNTISVTNNKGLLCVAMLPDGSIVTGDAENLIKIWNSSNDFSAPVQQFPGHTGHVNAITIGLHSEIVSASDDRTVRVWV